MTCKFHTFKTNRYMDIIKPILKQDNTLQQEQWQQQQQKLKKNSHSLLTYFYMISNTPWKDCHTVYAHLHAQNSSNFLEFIWSSLRKVLCSCIDSCSKEEGKYPPWYMWKAHRQTTVTYWNMYYILNIISLILQLLKHEPRISTWKMLQNADVPLLTNQWTPNLVLSPKNNPYFIFSKIGFWKTKLNLMLENWHFLMLKFI